MVEEWIGVSNFLDMSHHSQIFPAQGSAQRWQIGRRGSYPAGRVNTKWIRRTSTWWHRETLRSHWLVGRDAVVLQSLLRLDLSLYGDSSEVASATKPYRDIPPSSYFSGESLWNVLSARLFAAGVHVHIADKTPCELKRRVTLYN